MDPRIIEAARNNAAWCDAMCRAHGLPGTFGRRAWTNTRRTPLFYPDAVTVLPEATEADVLDGIDSGVSASVKDSFATLDLAGAGFSVLFEAQWIYRPAGFPAAYEPTTVRWDVVEGAEGLVEWEAAFHDEQLFRPELLADDTVSVLRGRVGGEVVCGSVLNTSGQVVGVSNVFGGDKAWAGTVAAAARLHPDRALVGYEDEAPKGFEAIGPLRVWLAS